MAQQVRMKMGPEETAELPSNIYETPGGEAYVIEIPVAGFRRDEILIEATVGSVTVTTRPRESKPGQKYLRREHARPSVSRVFEFPMDVDTDNVRATLENGMLTIEVPKAAAARRRVIRLA